MTYFVPPGTVFVEGPEEGQWVASEGWDKPPVGPSYPMPSAIQCGACGHADLVPVDVTVVGGPNGVIWGLRCPACEVLRWYPAVDYSDPEYEAAAPK